MRNGEFGLWAADGTLTIPPTTALAGDLEVDVAIVGGGYSGLWTAWALRRFDPDLRVAVFEATELGRGASGRNGGWLSGKPVGMRGVLERAGGRAKVQLVERLLHDGIHDVVRLMDEHGIDIEAVHGGWIQVARSEAEAARLQAALRAYRSWGVEDGHVRWLSVDELADEIVIARAVGALRSPDCYRIHPLKLVLGLARLVIDAGAEVYTRSRVTEIHPHRLKVGKHTVVARSVVIATEGHTAQQDGRRREVLPLNSAMIATAPLPADAWERIGWASHAGVSGAAHTYFYGQRTVDDRILLGGRGKPYRFRSGVDRRGEVDLETVDALQALLADLFPGIDTTVDHAWCGVLGVLRDWSPIVEDKGSDLYEIGGYAGQGVTAAKIAGTAVAAMITGTDTEERAIPWIRQRPRKWEPEPLRWLGATALYRAYGLADRHEARRGGSTTSPIARIADRLAGR